MITINNLPRERFESYAASAESTSYLVEVRYEIGAKTRIRIASASRDLSVVFYLTADELDALQTMLAEAYDSQEREE